MSEANITPTNFPEFYQLGSHLIPSDVKIELPQDSQLPEDFQHFLAFIPWEYRYLEYVPADLRDFFTEVLPFLNVRTTDVHTAICLNYLDELIEAATNQYGSVNRKVVAYSLILHDAGWSKLSEEEVANSLGVTGLKLTNTAIGPKEKHAVVGAEIAREILTDKKGALQLTDEEIELIVLAIRYHDKPEEVAGADQEMPIEVQLLVDLDHLWSFTRLNFWQDTYRKGVPAAEYLENLRGDLDSYFVTEIGKEKARELLAEREAEVNELDRNS